MLKKWDMFGVRVGMTYKGEMVHTTVLSALCSVSLIVYMIYFAATTFITSTDKVSTELLPTDPHEMFVPASAGFNLGLGFVNGLPKKYGQIKFKLIT